METTTNTGTPAIPPGDGVTIDKWRVHEMVIELFGLSACADAVDTALGEDQDLESAQLALMHFKQRLSALGQSLAQMLPSIVMLPEHIDPRRDA